MVARLRRRGVRVLEGESSGRRQRELRFFRRYGFRVTAIWIAHGEEGYAPVETLLRTGLLLDAPVTRGGAVAGLFGGESAPDPEPAHSSPG